MLFPGGGPSGTARWYANQSDPSGGQMGSQASYEIWFKTRATPTTPLGDEQKFGTLVTFTDSDAARPSNCNDRTDRVLYMDASGRLYFKYRVDKGTSANYVIRSTNTFADMNWHHVVVAWDITAGGGVRMWVNGQLEASDTVGIPWTSISNSNAVRVKIGGGAFVTSGGTVCNWLTGGADADDGIIAGTTFTGTNYYAAFDGSLDEFRLYRDNAGGIMTETLARQRFNATRCQTSTVFNFNAPVDQNWYHLTATYDSTTRVGKLFVNGAEECSATYPDGTNSTPSRTMILGGRGFFRNAAQTANTGWQGGLGDFKLYDSALSPTDVLKIYEETKNRFPGH
jgi:hypothetical protein